MENAPSERKTTSCIVSRTLFLYLLNWQGGALRSGFSCDFAAIHLLGHPALHVIVSIFALAILKPCGKYAIIVAFNTIS